MHEAEHPLFIPIRFLGFDNLLNPVTMTGLAVFLLFFLFYWASRKPQAVPKGAQNFVEMVIEFVQGQAQAQVGKHAPFFFPLFFYLFLFIFFSNLLGLVPGFVSPTSRVDVNLGMVLTVIFSTHFFGIKENGFWRHFAHYLPPKITPDPSAHWAVKLMMRAIFLGLCVMMPVIHLVGDLARPVSLTLRLFGNMMSKEIILAVLILLTTVFWGMSPIGKIFAVVPFFLRVFIVILGVFICFVQAYVFMLLSMIYIGGAVQNHSDLPDLPEASGEGSKPQAV